MENLDVNFIIDGYPCQGILNQEGDYFYLDVNSSLPAIAYKPRKIVCCHKRQVFVLHNNQICSRRIFPDFVVENYESPFFNTFKFFLDGLQDFLSVSEHYNGNVFSEKIEIDKTGYLCECVNDAEKTTVKITSPCKCIELEKIEDIVQRFIQFFTLVSYKRIACTSICVVDDAEEYKYYSLICKTFSGNKSRHYSLLHAGKMYSNGWWRNVLKNYFETKGALFELCLNGFVAQIDVEMFWESKIIYLCGIWNRLGKIRINEKISLYNGFCSLHNSFDKIFRLLFPNALNDFELLKDARNKVAHGELIIRSQEKFEELYQAFRRIRLLTIAFIYQELGLPLIFICECIRNSLHGCVRNAELDRFVLAKIIGDIPLFDVDQETWDYFTRPRIFSCFVYNPIKNLLELDEQTTELAWNKSLREREPFYENYVIKACPRYKKPVYQNTIFIIYGSAHKEINGSYLLNYEDVPAVLKEKCEVQRTDLSLRRARLHVS